MKVIMFTNTFVPHVGGVTRSILTLKAEMERRGHSVLVVAPSYDGYQADEPDVLRVPAIKKLAGSDYSMPVPMSRHIRDEIEAFGPDVIHVHHPFLLGDTGLRMAASLRVPSVFTYHTRYEFYLGPNVAPNGRLAHLVRSLADGFADVADMVVAPSASVRDILLERGVKSPIAVIPTGIDLAGMAAGDREGMRARLGFGPETFVVGHLGRLAPEKNLSYLGGALETFLKRNPDARFILSGRGPAKSALTERLDAAGVGQQVQMLDPFEVGDLASFYAAMDVFAFASHSETQGLVIPEALAAGTPVVALDAPGVREAVGGNDCGRLLPAEASTSAFSDALEEIQALPAGERAIMREAARAAAASYSVENMGSAFEELYTEMIAKGYNENTAGQRAWDDIWAGLATEAELIENMLTAVGAAVSGARPKRVS